jgi:hypothetical protein
MQVSSRFGVAVLAAGRLPQHHFVACRSGRLAKL